MKKLIITAVTEKAVVEKIKKGLDESEWYDIFHFFYLSIFSSPSSLFSFFNHIFSQIN